MNFTDEQLAKIKAAGSAEELLALAAENGITLTAEEAEKYFDQFHKKVSSLADAALADEELENVSGGSICKDGRHYSSTPPHYLITTQMNSCPAYKWMEPHNHGWSKDGYCRSCYFRDHADLSLTNTTMYCEHRRLENDPYR